MGNRIYDLELTQERAAWWLAAFFDGEGCIYYKVIPRKGRPAIRKSVTVGNSDKILILFASECLDILGIDHYMMVSKMKRSGKPFWCIGLRRMKDILKFYETVPIQHPGKRERLKQIVDNVKKPCCVRCQGDLDKETPGCRGCYHRHRFREKLKLKKVFCKGQPDQVFEET